MKIPTLIKPVLPIKSLLYLKKNGLNNGFGPIKNDLETSQCLIKKTSLPG